jgi:hypothetical protein
MASKRYALDVRLKKRIQLSGMRKIPAGDHA